jgi:hypothetical protein
MTDELAELKARVAELEARAKPPEPFNPGPAQRFDYTEGFSMPASTLRDMVNCIPDYRDDAMRDSRTPRSPVSMIPEKVSGATERQGLPQSSTPGWQAEVPLGPQPGINHVDALCEEDDRRERATLQSNLSRTEYENLARAEFNRQLAATDAALEACKKSKARGG